MIKPIKMLVFTLSILTLGVLQACKSETKESTIETTKDTSIKLMTKDSIEIIGDLFELDKTAPTILLFHQGGSNSRAEYKSIVPILSDKGYNILAIDQRVGGQIYGGYNRTVEHITHNDFGYCDAYADLESALNYIISEGFSGKKILWGSSYSASLAIQLAHNRPDEVDAVLAFSPASGQQLNDCLPNGYFETLKVPLLLLRPDTEAEYESVKEQLALAENYNHQTYIAENGAHGSSMLVTERTKNQTDKAFNTVLNFIESNIK